MASREFVVVMITTPADQGQRIARALVERKLAACVTVLPAAHSTYRWQGAIEEADEAVLMVKTRGEAVASLTEAVRDLHPYENFEIIALPIEDGSPSYLTWLLESVELPDAEEEHYFH